MAKLLNVDCISKYKKMKNLFDGERNGLRLGRIAKTACAESGRTFCRTCPCAVLDHNIRLVNVVTNLSVVDLERPKNNIASSVARGKVEDDLVRARRTLLCRWYFRFDHCVLIDVPRRIGDFDVSFVDHLHRIHAVIVHQILIKQNTSSFFTFAIFALRLNQPVISAKKLRIKSEAKKKTNYV